MFVRFFGCALRTRVVLGIKFLEVQGSYSTNSNWCLSLKYDHLEDQGAHHRTTFILIYTWVITALNLQVLIQVPESGLAQPNLGASPPPNMKRVAVKEFNLSYYIGETTIDVRYIHIGK